MNRLTLSGLFCSFLGIGAIPIIAVAKNNPDLNTGCLVRAARASLSVDYPVRLQILGDDAKGLGSGVVTVSHPDGSDPLSVDCAKPDVTVLLPAGAYVATVDAAAGPAKNLNFRVQPSREQRTLALRLSPSVPALTDR
jgi:hypothetical protein